jgi:hypothetical protein
MCLPRTERQRSQIWQFKSTPPRRCRWWTSGRIVARSSSSAGIAMRLRRRRSSLLLLLVVMLLADRRSAEFLMLGLTVAHRIGLSISSRQKPIQRSPPRRTDSVLQTFKRFSFPLVSRACACALYRLLSKAKATIRFRIIKISTPP